MPSNYWMVVGLGNPGPAYRKNRHNIGFMVVDALVDTEPGLTWQTATRFSAQMIRGVLASQDSLLVKPQTFMNLSGQCVDKLARFYNIPVDRILAIHDDLDLALGRLKIKVGGGDGGHKGIRSMAQCLRSPAFIRFRVGIGRPVLSDEVTDYVLQDFRPAERATINQQIQRATEAVRFTLEHGLVAAMNQYNGQIEGERLPTKSL